jgi:hypothetical protein
MSSYSHPGLSATISTSVMMRAWSSLTGRPIFIFRGRFTIFAGASSYGPRYTMLVASQHDHLTHETTIVNVVDHIAGPTCINR